MRITKYFEPESGVAAISPIGLQTYPEKLNSYSSIFTNIVSSSQNSKHIIDSCWESGNIYYGNYGLGYVKKIQFNGTEIASLTSLIHPVCVSVIQHAMSMDISIPSVPPDDNGCWIADIGSGKIIKTDKNLKILYEYVGVTNPVCIAADIDGGCLVADDGALRILKLSSTGTLLDSINYSNLVPAIPTYCSYLKEIKPFKPHYITPPVYSTTSSSSSSASFSDESSSSTSEEDAVVGRFWFMGGDRVYQLYYRNGSLQQTKVINPLIGQPEDYSVASIDVDLNDNNFYLYIGIGNDHESVLSKYTWRGTKVIDEFLSNVSFPYILKTVQGYASSCLYVLSDISRWSPCLESTSSSSSSPSSLEFSSSSSSSSSQGVSSSSSSSTSSLGYSSSSSSSANIFTFVGYFLADVNGTEKRWVPIYTRTT